MSDVVDSEISDSKSRSVPAGYKQTEAGVVPEEWRVLALQEVCRAPVSYGIVQCGPHIEGGVPYIRVSDMDATELNLDQMLRTSRAIASRFPRSTVEEGDLVYALRGKTGEVRRVQREVAGANLTQGTARLAPSQNIETEYFIWAMRSPSTRRQGLLEAKGTTFREITLADLRRILVVVPPLPEQRAIASALSDVDALLGALDRLIAKKRDLKQAAMQQLLTGQTRLPGFHGEWEVTQVGETTTKVGSGITPTGGNRVYKSEGRPFLRSQNVGWGTLLLDDVAFIDDAIHSSFADTEIKSGDVFLNITGASIGRSSVADSRVEGGNVNQHVCIVRPDYDRLTSKFLNCLLLSSLGQGQIDSFQAGGNREGLNFAQVRSIRLPLPTVREQTAIAEVLSEMDAEIAALEQRQDKTRALKQGMMQELLTGKTRLISVEEKP